MIMWLSRKEIIELCKHIVDDDTDVCYHCPFRNTEQCYSGIRAELLKRKIELSQFEKNHYPFNYFNCNEALKAILKSHRVLKI